jgi:hypothetical protein
VVGNSSPFKSWQRTEDHTNIQTFTDAEKEKTQAHRGTDRKHCTLHLHSGYWVEEFLGITLLVMVFIQRRNKKMNYDPVVVCSLYFAIYMCTTEDYIFVFNRKATSFVLSYCYGIFACFFFCRKQIMKLSKKNMKS